MSALCLVACGQIAGPPSEGDDDDDGPTGRQRRDGGSHTDAGGRNDGGSKRDAGPGARNDYVDPECGDIPPPLEVYDCDPFAQTGCANGEACSPYVEYPSDPCSSETYGAFCIPAGTLGQGESCDSQLDCAPGFLCLITGAGTTCGQTCDLENPDTCTDGLICVSTDVSGIGACY